MARHGIAMLCVMALLLSLAPIATSSASDEGFVVIVHPSNAVTALDRGFLRAAYLKEGVKWRDGSAVVPIALSAASPVHERFVDVIVGKSVSQLRNYWVQRIFSGRGVPPVQASSVHEAIAHVLTDPRAVAYLPVDADPGRAKVVSLHGR